MKYEQYVSLIRRLEVSAGKSRRVYELRVLGLAMLGYGYFFLLIALLGAVPLILIIGLFTAPEAVLKLLLWTAKLWFVAIPALVIYFGFIGSAVKSLFAKVPEPEGRTLEREDAPELFDFIDSTCKALKAKRPNQVFLGDDFNASVITIPRIGVFGAKPYIHLGLPVMQALSPQQFNAVLAHEIGHISGKHGGFGKWAYQLQEAWGRFLQSQEVHGQKLSALYEEFVKWFFPYFQANTFVLMREHEKEADDYAVGLTDAKALGGALILLHTRSSTLEKVFWPKIEEENRANPTPSPDIFSRMLGSLSFIDPNLDTSTIEKAIKVPTDYEDSHPSLVDRLKSIGYWNGEGLPEIPPHPEQTAADLYLGKNVDKYVIEIENKWAEEIGKVWGARFEQFKTSEERIGQLDSKAASEDLTIEELLEKAGIVAEKHGIKEATPLIREVLEKNPDHAEATYLMGAVLLQQEDETGLDHIRRAIELDEKWKFAASEVGFAYLRSKGRLEEAKEFANVLESQEQMVAAANNERASVSPGDTFGPHTMTDEIVAAIVQRTRWYEEIDAIYLAAKEVEYFKDVPFNVIFIDIRKASRFSREKDMKPNDLLNAVAKRLEDLDIGYFVMLNGNLAPLKATADAIPGARIFHRESDPA